MLAAGLLLTACSDNSIQESGYMNITPQQAKEIMETEKDFVILDVRTQEEYDEGHIEGAVLLPDYEVSAKAESVLQ